MFMCWQFVHAHLVQLIGVVTLGDPVMVVLEYCEYGSLDGYLKKNEVHNEIKVKTFLCTCFHTTLTVDTADPPCRRLRRGPDVPDRTWFPASRCVSAGRSVLCWQFGTLSFCFTGLRAMCS
jgi:hypothetical protein